MCCSFFFFSSRRRHTRWPRDWSSDVCSSDLIRGGTVLFTQERGGGLAQPLAGRHVQVQQPGQRSVGGDRKSTRLNSSHVAISYAVFCLKKKKKKINKLGI